MVNSNPLRFVPVLVGFHLVLLLGLWEPWLEQLYTLVALSQLHLSALRITLLWMLGRAHGVVSRALAVGSCMELCSGYDDFFSFRYLFMGLHMVTPYVSGVLWMVQLSTLGLLLHFE